MPGDLDLHRLKVLGGIACYCFTGQSGARPPHSKGTVQSMNVIKRVTRCLLMITVVAVCCSTIALAQTAKRVNAKAPAEVIAELQKLLSDEVAGTPSLPGELLHVQAPRQGIDVSLAAGVFDRESKQPLDPHHVFRVASVTKTFVAAAILRLYEDGKIKLDDPINHYLPQEYNTILDKGGYPSNVITVRQLLTHTSGMFDYARAKQYYEIISANPKHRWTRKEQVEDAIIWGTPRAAPGKEYDYSDTGYVLLGEMLERLTGKSLGSALRSLLNFKKLKLDETYLETLEPTPAGIKPLAHPYFGEIDAVDFDPSVDLYGGGGLVSSVEDLARFYRALVQGKIFQRDSTLQMMLTVPPTNNDAAGGPYAMGIQRRHIAGNVCWGHNGFWGTSAYHCPDIDVTIVRHYNQAQPNGLIFKTLYEQIGKSLLIAN
ncbi:MAG TPA: serine hydrolase [Blastocatellia bacterium]|nr:serine hydrolase [Blastocatellia bacterium]